MSVLRVGILGAGRSRAGLGPFFARWFESERVSGRVTAIAGRDLGRTQAAAASLAEDLGHEVAAREGIDGLLEPGDLDAVVIAAPPEAHLAALEAALEAGVPTLCEKPLVPVDQTDRALDVCAGFVERGVLLMENCQWPETLGAFETLHPEGLADWRCGDGDTSFVMRLSPSQRGAAMLSDSVSHFLSMIQALSGDGVTARLTGPATFSEPMRPDVAAVALDARVALAGGLTRAVRLELVHCPDQPRPAWYSVAGHALHREVEMPSYQMFACSAGERVPMDDPLGALVYRFALSVRESAHDRIERNVERIRGRASLFRELLQSWQ